MPPDNVPVRISTLNDRELLAFIYVLYTIEVFSIIIIQSYAIHGSKMPCHNYG